METRTTPWEILMAIHVHKFEQNHLFLFQLCPGQSSMLLSCWHTYASSHTTMSLFTYHSRFPGWSPWIQWLCNNISSFRQKPLETYPVASTSFNPQSDRTFFLTIWTCFLLLCINKDIISDKGHQFISHVWTGFMEKLEVIVILTLGYHTQTNNQVKVFRIATAWASLGECSPTAGKSS